MIPSKISLKMVTDCPEYPSGRGALVVGDSDVTEVTNSYGD